METIASLILGTFAFSLALTITEGPYGALYKFRRYKPIDDFGLLNCFICTSFWVALILCLIYGRFDLFLLAWGGANLINGVTK